MKEKTVKDRSGKKQPADTARPGGAAYAPHDPGAEKLAERAGNDRTGTGDDRTPAGDDRTPDKTIGEIKYAQKPGKK
jgi:hypothetical protein